MQHDRRQTYPRKLCALLGTLQGLNGRVLSSAVSKHFRPVQLDIRSAVKEKEKPRQHCAQQCLRRIGYKSPSYHPKQRFLWLRNTLRREEYAVHFEDVTLVVTHVLYSPNRCFSCPRPDRIHCAIIRPEVSEDQESPPNGTTVR